MRRGCCRLATTGIKQQKWTIELCVISEEARAHLRACWLLSGFTLSGPSDSFIVRFSTQSLGSICSTTRSNDFRDSLVRAVSLGRLMAWAEEPGSCVGVLCSVLWRWLGPLWVEAPEGKSMHWPKNGPPIFLHPHVELRLEEMKLMMVTVSMKCLLLCLRSPKASDLLLCGVSGPRLIIWVFTSSVFWIRYARGTKLKWFSQASVFLSLSEDNYCA